MLAVFCITNTLTNQPLCIVIYCIDLGFVETSKKTMFAIFHKGFALNNPDCRRQSKEPEDILNDFQSSHPQQLLLHHLQHRRRPHIHFHWFDRYLSFYHKYWLVHIYIQLLKY